MGKPSIFFVSELVDCLTTSSIAKLNGEYQHYIIVNKKMMFFTMSRGFMWNATLNVGR